MDQKSSSDEAIPVSRITLTERAMPAQASMPADILRKPKVTAQEFVQFHGRIRFPKREYLIAWQSYKSVNKASWPFKERLQQAPRNEHVLERKRKGTRQGRWVRARAFKMCDFRNRDVFALLY